MYYSNFLRISPVFAFLWMVTGCATWTSGPDRSVPTDPRNAPETLSVRQPAPVQAQVPEPIPVSDSEDTSSKSEPQNPTAAAQAGFDDIWARIRAGFQLSDLHHPYIERELRHFVAHFYELRRTQRRAEPFLYLILQEVERRGMPTELTLLPAVESAFHAQAYSPNHAAGIWQFIPSTGRHFGLQQNWWYDGRRDVLASTRAALDYLQRLHRRFGGDWELALAAYNAGQGSVAKAMRKNKREGKNTDFGSLRLPLETRLYIPRLLALCRIIAAPEDFGITLEPIANQPRLASVDTQSQLDLALAAEMADISTDELHRLNPGFNRWATAPEGPHRLLLPLDKAEGFQARLTRLDPDKRLQWTRYRIEPGDSLGVIARKHNLTVSHLKAFNNLRDSRIRAGSYLLIPDRGDLAKADPAVEAPRLAKSRSGDDPVSYTVRPGDTLWDIGRAFKISYHKLAKWNDLTPGATLHPKQKLLIWKQAGY